MTEAAAPPSLSGLFAAAVTPRSWGTDTILSRPSAAMPMSVRPAAYYAASTDMCALQAELPRQQERYGELRLPVFILFGRADRLLHFQQHGEALKDKVPQARLDALPGGHMLPVTAPAETAAWLEQAARATLQPAR